MRYYYNISAHGYPDYFISFFDERYRILKCDGSAAYTILIFHIGCHELCNTGKLGSKCFCHNFLIFIHTYYLQLRVLMWRIRSWHSTYCAMDSSRTPMWCARAFFRSFIYFIAWYLLSRVWFNPAGAASILVISYTNGNVRIITWVQLHHDTVWWDTCQVNTVIQRSCLDAQILVLHYE